MSVSEGLSGGLVLIWWKFSSPKNDVICVCQCGIHRYLNFQQSAKEQQVCYKAMCLSQLKIGGRLAYWAWPPSLVCHSLAAQKRRSFCILKVRKINQNLHLWVPRFITATRVNAFAAITISSQMYVLLNGWCGYVYKIKFQQGWSEPVWVPQLKLGYRPPPTPPHP